jgi:hypothetical protein
MGGARSDHGQTRRAAAMEPLDLFLKLFEAFKDRIPPGAGMVPVALGGALLAFTLFMKAGKYHLDKATTLSQIGAAAVTQLQASQRLTQEELAVTRAALYEANRMIAELIQKLTASEAREILVERGAALVERRLDEALFRLQAQAERGPPSREQPRLAGPPGDDAVSS